MSNLFKVPKKENLVDQQFFQVIGPDQILTGYQFDSETCTLYAKESQIIIPSFHGATHVGEDPVPLATTDTQGHMSRDDKAKLEALLQTRIGVLGFAGSGFPDDGGFMQGDILLAAGSEFISLERIGNTVRFTVDTPAFINCNCEECAQIFWIVDESEPSSIRPPSCNGKMPGVNAYGEMKVYIIPENVIVDSTNPLETLNQFKPTAPAMVFKRYENAISGGNTAEWETILQRNTDNTTKVGWAMTPGPLGVPEAVWFMGNDDDGLTIRFELDSRTEPGMLGALLYKGHTLTRRPATITGYDEAILGNNVYKVKYWDINESEVVANTDEFSATNHWQFLNPENTATATNPKTLVLDKTKQLLPIGTLVQLWEFKIGENNGVDLTRAFFIKEPDLPAESTWSLSAAIAFGDMLSARMDTTASGTLLTASELIDTESRLVERTIWGITGFEDRLILSDDGETVEVSSNIYEPSGQQINNLIVADIDTDVPGLVVSRVPSDPTDSPGDINGDGVVDEEDLRLVCESFGRTAADVGWNPDADINKDGVVDVRDLSIVGLHHNISVDSVRERPVFLWHRPNHKNFIFKTLIGMPDQFNSLQFPPYDILLRAPIDRLDDSYLKVIRRGVIATGPFSGLPYIIIKGLRWEDMPPSGTLRILTGVFRNTLWNYNFKTAWSSFDDNAHMLIGDDEFFPFDEDYPCGTDFGSTGIGEDYTSGDDSVPGAPTVVQILHTDFTAPVLRLEFVVNEEMGSESVQLQFKAGILDQSLPYELNQDTDLDDLVRGLRPGYTVSQVHTQDGIITDGIGDGIVSDPTNFKVYEGGELAIPVDGMVEKWNELLVMARDDQVWVWWNDMLVSPDAEASAALPTPVTGLENIAYFPMEFPLEIGKVGMRLWPGSVVRTAEISDQNMAFNEFTLGQLAIIS
jgi:hypothetical protein